MVTCQKMFPLVAFFRISGNAASDKNIKDGVCAQIEKNFAKAKWKVLFIYLIHQYIFAHPHIVSFRQMIMFVIMTLLGGL